MVLWVCRVCCLAHPFGSGVGDIAGHTVSTVGVPSRCIAAPFPQSSFSHVEWCNKSRSRRRYARGRLNQRSLRTALVNSRPTSPSLGRLSCCRGLPPSRARSVPSQASPQLFFALAIVSEWTGGSGKWIRTGSGHLSSRGLSAVRRRSRIVIEWLGKWDTAHRR